MKVNTVNRQSSIASCNYVVFTDANTVALLVSRAIDHKIRTVNGGDPHEWIIKLMTRGSKDATFLLNVNKRIMGIDNARHTSLIKDNDWVFNDPTIVGSEKLLELMEGL